jgi:flagellar assembly factor FliW
MLTISKTRFGTVTVREEAVIDFPNGMIGFPNDHRFVLLERTSGDGSLSALGYLQSAVTPALCFPVIDATAIGGDYPKPDPSVLATSVGLGQDDLAVLVVVAVPGKGKPMRANLLAPLVVDVKQRRGAQVVLDHRNYAAATHLDERPPTSLPPGLVPSTPIALEAAAHSAP